MGLDAASSCTSSDTTATLRGPAATGIESHGCALPTCPESPLPSSEFSTSSSSTSETFFTSAGASTRFEKTGAGDITSANSTISSKKDPSSAQFNCNGVSSGSFNIPSPIFEEDLAISMREFEESDGISKDLDLDMKPCFGDMCPTDGRCQVGDGDMLLSRLDKLLDSDSAQEEVDESGLFFMNDLFPDLSCPQEFCTLDEMSSFPSVDNYRGFEPHPSLPNVEETVAVCSSTSFIGEEESVSQMFAQWLQTNAHHVSLSDLRKIKLKTSTIENATRRLGGGQKGLLLFLKFVLMWVQNLCQSGRAGKQEDCVSPTLHSGVPPLPSSKGTAATGMHGASKRHTFGTTEVPNVHAQAQPPFSGCGSLQGPQSSISAQPNLSSSISSGYTSISNGGAYSSLARTNGCAYNSFPNTNFYQCNSQWLPHSSGVVHGVCPTSLQTSLRPVASGVKDCVGGTRSADSSSLTMSSQQRQCTDANPAATFRAARKNRMERQRWSVRRNRKWAASNQHQHLGAVTSPNGYAHSHIASWPPQSLANGLQKLPYLSSQSRQPFAKGTSATDHQQSKRQEKNLKLLFHKELKQSDVGTLGRIVLPKAAETCLPPLELRDGVNLVVEDINMNKIWKMRYRFWPNNKSRMYLLENTSDFVKLNDLKEGDYMMMYLDSHSNKYVIRGVKGTGMPSGALPACNAAEVHVGEKRKTSLSKEEASGLGSFSPDGANCEDSCDDSLLVDLIEQSLEDF